MKKYMIIVALLFLVVSCDTNKFQENFNLRDRESWSNRSFETWTLQDNWSQNWDTETWALDEPQYKINSTWGELNNNLEINYNVAFYSQFPLTWTGKYAEPYQNFCEEASLLSAYYYFNSMTPSKETYISDLMKLKDIEDRLFWENWYRDTSLIESLVSLLFFQNEEYLDEFLSTESEQEKMDILENMLIANAEKWWVSWVIEDFPVWNLTQEEIKQRMYNSILSALVNWSLVVVPVYWKWLENPYFSDGWPVYHNFLITWVTWSDIDEWVFITQEVWTTRWADFEYDKEVVLENIYDFDRALYPDNFTDGEQRILILFKNDTITTYWF